MFCRPRLLPGGGVGGFCCQVPPEPRCSLSGYSKCLIIVGICESSPITVVQCRVKARPLPRTSILFRPLEGSGLSAPNAGRSPENPGEPESLVEAPGTAPGSATLIPQDVYHHSRSPDPFNIGPFGAEIKGGATGRAAPTMPGRRAGKTRRPTFDGPARAVFGSPGGRRILQAPGGH